MGQLKQVLLRWNTLEPIEKFMDSMDKGFF